MHRPELYALINSTLEMAATKKSQSNTKNAMVTVPAGGGGVYDGATSDQASIKFVVNSNSTS